ncbi:GDSL-type esterase/lipase family protein [Clostridium sp. FP1]|uniref:GDSL-type esterase/lipase family protein n=1 Tax=Clostridium sp. FP1 TaxID=2724076 RepID=UPI0013E91D08|nr:GDSL-type esterase/lipase family protein [Clostridium sp. FP1]MBZ9634353.1 GDSL-type esterase/lipase family protein [Clostridium sp. FP1]
MTSNRKKNKIKIIPKLILLTVLILCYFSVKSFLKYTKGKELLEKNYIVLQKLEQVNIADVEKKITQNHKLNHAKSDINLTKTSNKIYFEKSVFMGDSITEGLDFYNIVNKSSVLAKKGQNVVTAKEEVSKLSSINPKRIFILYGMNDLSLFENPDDFKNNYIKLIEDIKQTFPSAEIYLQSLTPVQAKVQNKNENFSQSRIDKFVEKVIEVSKEENVHYIDIRSVARGIEDVYEPDGMHFTMKFYGLWLDYLRSQLEN